jgi:hypothetical protein
VPKKRRKRYRLIPLPPTLLTANSVGPGPTDSDPMEQNRSDRRGIHPVARRGSRHRGSRRESRQGQPRAPRSWTGWSSCRPRLGRGRWCRSDGDRGSARGQYWRDVGQLHSHNRTFVTAGPIGLRSAGVSVPCNSRVARARGHVITACIHQFVPINRNGRRGAGGLRTLWLGSSPLVMCRCRRRWRSAVVRQAPRLGRSAR